jgi:hypothetical protein
MISLQFLNGYTVALCMVGGGEGGPISIDK